MKLKNALSPRLAAILDTVEFLAGWGCLLWALNEISRPLAVGVLGAILIGARVLQRWVR